MVNTHACIWGREKITSLNQVVVRWWVMMSVCECGESDGWWWVRVTDVRVTLRDDVGMWCGKQCQQMLCPARVMCGMTRCITMMQWVVWGDLMECWRRIVRIVRRRLKEQALLNNGVYDIVGLLGPRKRQIWGDIWILLTKLACCFPAMFLMIVNCYYLNLKFISKLCATNQLTLLRRIWHQVLEKLL